MIRVEVIEPQTAAWKKWLAKCKKKTKDDLKNYKKGKTVQIRDALYKEQKSIFLSVGGAFKGKCAYCESELFTHAGDVDHYRPKKGIKNSDGKSVYFGRKKRKHPGYFWLAYDWLNFIPLCIGCNRVAGKFGKGEYFPLESGKHAIKPADVKREKPLLLNPRVDDPSAHMKFRLDNGWVVGTTARGMETIRIIGLNERQLPRERLQEIKTAELEFLAAMGSATPDRYNQVMASIRERLRPFTRVRNLKFDELSAVTEARIARMRNARDGVDRR